MDRERLQELIAEGEQLSIEFKGEGTEPLGDRDLVETVVCLCNRLGEGSAWLLVGVEDDRSVTGARPRHEGGRTDVGRVQALIAARTRPSVSVRAEIIDHPDGPVLAIEIPHGGTSPVGTSDGRYLRRVIGGDGKPACVPFHFHEMQARQADRGLLDPSTLIFPDIRFDDLDPLEFDRYRRAVRENRARGDTTLLELSNVELARVLGAVEAREGEDIVRLLGLLLFGAPDLLASNVPAHEVAFQVLSGTDVLVNDIVRWPLVRAMEEIEARFRARHRETELQVGMLRVGVPDYSPLAFREGLANALIHRDYGRLGAVHVQWHDDRIEISSPGGFPEGVRLDNLLVTPPRPRNPLLADAFKRAGIVERTARGIDTIYFEQLRNGRPVPSYDRSTEAGVVLVLPGGEANLAFVQLVTEEAQADRPLSLDALLLLNQLWLERSVTTEAAAAVIQKPEAEARAGLQRLVEAGLVEPRGERKGRSWHLSSRTYERLGEKSAYVRQRGFEPFQQEQMVLQYVDAHGRIQRGEAAELCRISPDQASRLLQKLVSRGDLEMHGKRKGAWYARPAE